MAPYDTWATAATNIQAAIAYANTNPDTVSEVLITNGVYVLSAALTLSRSNLTVRSVNGAKATILDGNNAVRVMYFGTTSSNIVIQGLWLRNGTAGDGGGGSRVDGTHIFFRECIFTRNQATSGHDGDGGAVKVYSGRLTVLENCLLVGNYSLRRGGAVETHNGNAYLVLVNCTLTGNRADENGGAIGSWGGTIAATNCIVYGNSAGGSGPNYTVGTYRYCNADPLPSGTGNMDVAPGFVQPGSGYGLSHTFGDYRLSSGSPVIDAGTDTGLTMDLEGKPRPMDGDGDSTPKYDMGAYESYGPNDGPLRTTPSVTPTVGFAPLQAVFTVEQIAGEHTNITAYIWLFGDGNTLEGTALPIPPVTNVYANGGTYLARLILSNDMGEVTTNPAASTVRAINPTVYVSLTGAHISPFVSWAHAATNLFDALAVADAADTYTTTVRIAAGSYGIPTTAQTLLIDKPIVIRSENGPLATILKGSGSIPYPVVRTTANAGGFRIEGFTIRDGYAHSNGGNNDGGGVRWEGPGTFDRCIFVNNRASEDGGTMAGHSISPYPMVLRNCLFMGNETPRFGGAIHAESGSYLIENCTIVGNGASGGATAEASGDGPARLPSAIRLSGATPQRTSTRIIRALE